VRREISFAEQNEKRIFPILVSGDEDDSIPLRLSNHQYVDLRRNFHQGMDELANALHDHLGTTKIIRRRKPEPPAPVNLAPADLKRFVLPGLLVLIALGCIAGLAVAARVIYATINSTLPTQAVTPTSTEPFVLATAQDIGINEEPAGKIVYTCQVQGEEICVINADGSGWRRLTNLPSASNYASLSPEGDAVVFVGRQTGSAEVYELDLSTGAIQQLTQFKMDVGSPEISPDNKLIAFTYRPGNNIAQLWIMNRDGSDPHEFYRSRTHEAQDPTWSPDGTQILFAMGKGENNTLYILGIDGRDPHVVNATVNTRGRSDWSRLGLLSFDMGEPLQHYVYTMNVDGNNLKKFSDGNNSQGASFSPDGKWIVFTAYANLANRDLNSCEIYIMRVDGTDLRRLTENNYCDYQPRWGK
jgi:TolB protein